MAELIIEQEVLAVMEQDAINAFPNECCGFFFGKEEGESRLVV